MKVFLTVLAAGFTAIASADVAPAAMNGTKTVQAIKQIVGGGAAAQSAEQALTAAVGAERTASLLGAIKSLQTTRQFGGAATDWAALEAASASLSSATVVENLISINANKPVDPNFYGPAVFVQEAEGLVSTIAGSSPREFLEYCIAGVPSAAATCSALKAKANSGLSSARASLQNMMTFATTALGNIARVTAKPAYVATVVAVAANFAHLGYAAEPAAANFAIEQVATGFKNEPDSQDYPVDLGIQGYGNAMPLCLLNGNTSELCTKCVKPVGVTN